MGRFLWPLMVLLSSVSAGWAQTGISISVTGNGWTLTADAEQGVINIAHDNLGTVMKDVRLNLQGEHDLVPLKNWLAEKRGESQLFTQRSNQVAHY